MCFAWTCRPVGKYRCISTFYDSWDQRLDSVSVYLTTVFFPENFIKGVFLLFTAMIYSKHGSVLVFELFFDRVQHDLLYQYVLQSYYPVFVWDPNLQFVVLCY